MAGRCYTKVVVIEPHDPCMTNHFMNDLTDLIQVHSTFQQPSMQVMSLSCSIHSHTCCEIIHKGHIDTEHDKNIIQLL